MNQSSIVRTVSTLILFAAALPFLSAVYHPGGLREYLIAGALQALLIATAAWALGRCARKDGPGPNMASRAAAALLLGSWAVAALALNMQAPPQGQTWLATLADQHVRYAALVIGALASFGGVTVLAARLQISGQAVLPALGFASSIISTMLFTLHFLAYPLLTSTRYEQELILGSPPTWWAPCSALLSSIAYVHTYGAHLSSILFALALRRSGLLGNAGSVCVAGLSFAAAIVGTYIHLPPAVVFVPPYLMGVLLLQHHASAPADSIPSRAHVPMP